MTDTGDQDPQHAALELLRKKFPHQDPGVLKAQLFMAKVSQQSGKLLDGDGGGSTGTVTVAANGTVTVQDAAGGSSSCVQSAQQGLQQALATAQKSTPMWLRIAEELAAYATYYLTIANC
ncbi:MAG: hypothetical protein JO144_08265 [Actinobacteria bacterium]|nr:hypothetical protein [Actinomycetota bacterium]